MATTFVGPSPYLVIFAIVADGGGTATLTPSRPLRVVDVVGYQTAAGGAADTVRIDNNGAAITNNISQNVADTTVWRATTIDDANQSFTAAGPLQIVVVAGAASNASHLFITCVPA
mgnify:CR=1 FL=1